MIKQCLKAGGLGLSLALLVQNAIAEPSSSQHGVIHIVGEIVETPCDVQPNAQQIVMRCYRNGKWMQSTMSSPQTTQGALPGNMGTISTRYSNVQRTLAVMTIAYY